MIDFAPIHAVMAHPEMQRILGEAKREGGKLLQARYCIWLEVGDCDPETRARILAAIEEKARMWSMPDRSHYENIAQEYREIYPPDDPKNLAAARILGQIRSGA